MKIFYELNSISVFLLMYNEIFGSETWDYGKHGPNVWKDINPTCGGQKQSPINIKTGCTRLQTFQPFHLTSSHNELVKFLLTNNGHTIVGKAIDVQFSFTGADLDGTFTFDSFHLHWGPNYNTGSEHQINGDQYAGESHFVYRNEQINKSAVLSFFMETRNVTNNNRKFYNIQRENQWITYFDVAQYLIHENDSKIINLTLSLLMGENFDLFWRYEGSLTTPPCTENVFWTIFKQPILILNYDFELFRDKLFFESYRGPQPLYNRKVLQSFEDSYVSPIPDQRCCSKGTTSELFLPMIILMFFISLFIYQ